VYFAHRKTYPHELGGGRGVWAFSLPPIGDLPMYVEIDSDDQDVVESIVVAQMRREKNVRLTLSQSAGRYSATLSSMQDEPDGTTEITTPISS
jgi:hypothetical protein